MPTNDHVVVEDPTGARATVGEAAAELHKLKGFSVLGPAVAPGVPVTQDEQDELDAAPPAPATKSGTPAATPKKEK